MFLSSITKNSKALREEVDYGINTDELPVIVVYPGYSEKSSIADFSKKEIKQEIKNLWDKLPKFRDSMSNVPTLHIPNKKEVIKSALDDKGFMVNTKKDAGIYFYS